MFRPLPRLLLLTSPSNSPRSSALNRMSVVIPPPSPHFLAAIPREKHSTRFAPTCVKLLRVGSPSLMRTPWLAMPAGTLREDHLRQTHVPHPGAARLDARTHQRRPPHLSTPCHRPKDRRACA